MLSLACILCGYELHAQAVSLVQAQRTRPSVARDAQSLCDPRVGVHAAADPGQQSSGLLSPVPEAIPNDWLARALSTQGGHGGLGWAWVLRAGSESPSARQTGRGDREPNTGRSRGLADTAGWRPVHSGSCGVLCLREACPDRRYERAQSVGASFWLEGCVGARRTARAEAGRASVEIQSGTDGARGAGLHCTQTEMSRVPG